MDALTRRQVDGTGVDLQRVYSGTRGQRMEPHKDSSLPGFCVSGTEGGNVLPATGFCTKLHRQAVILAKAVMIVLQIDTLFNDPV